MTNIGHYWDRAASTFDDEPDHGLRDPAVRTTWAARLGAWLPAPPAAVADIGCGTGSVAALLDDAGHRVVGVDLSARMLTRARDKLPAGTRLLRGDATAPPLRAGSTDVVLARHLLWTLPDPVAALRNWLGLLRPGGRAVLIEGRWGTPGPARPYAAGAEAAPWLGGVPAQTLVAALRSLVPRVEVYPLTEPALWGRPIDDERYAAVAYT